MALGWGNRTQRYAFRYDTFTPHQPIMFCRKKTCLLRLDGDGRDDGGSFHETLESHSAGKYPKQGDQG
jgi:hypothetical protein